MKIGTGTAFGIALAIHAVIIVCLVINISLDKPQRPKEGAGSLMHATFISAPPAKGSPGGSAGAPVQKAEAEKPKVEDQAQKKAEEQKKAQQEEIAKKMEAQRQAEQKRQEAIALKKAEEKKAEARKEQRKVEEKKAESIEFSSSSLEDLVSAVRSSAYTQSLGSVQTDAEKVVGQSIDFKG